MKRILTAILFCLPFFAKAQDTIVTKTGKAISDKVFSKIPSAATVGTIKEDYFSRTSLGSEYTATIPSSTIDMTGNRFKISGGGNAANDYIKYNWGTCSENYTITVDYVNKVIDATTQGLQIGQYSDNTNGYVQSNRMGLYQNTGNGNLGKAFFYEQSGAYTVVSTSGAIASISVGDSMRLVIRRNNYIQSCVATNITTGQSSTVLATFTLQSPLFSINNQSKPCIWNYNGTGDSLIITRFKYELNDIANPDMMCASNSIGLGSSATSISNRWASLFYNNTYQVVNSSGGADVTQSIVNRLPEIKKVNPKYFVLMDGSNDVQFGVTMATIMSNMQKIRDSLVSWGIPVIHAAPFPRNAYPMLPLRDSIYNRFRAQGDIVVTETYDSCHTAGSISAAYNSGDNVHPNDAGHARIAYFIKQYLPIKGLQQSAYVAGTSSLAAGLANEIQYNVAGVLGTTPTLKYNPTGLLVSTKNYSGLLASATVTSTANTDTLVGATIVPPYVTGAHTGVVKRIMKWGNNTYANSDDVWNISIGNGASAQPATGHTFYVGKGAGEGNTSGQYQVGIGFESLRYSSAATGGIGIGYMALGYNNAFSTNAAYSIGIGHGAGGGTTNAGDAIWLGRNSGIQSTAASNSFGALLNALALSPNASNTIALGQYSFYSAANANMSVGFGPYVGQYATGANKSFFGINYAGFRAANAYETIGIGEFAIRGATGMNNSIALGYHVGDSTKFILTGNNNMIWGTNITLPTASTSNTADLGNVAYFTGLYGTRTGTPSETPQTTGKMGINTVPNASAVLDLGGVLGGLILNRVTATEASAITPVDGLMFYVTNTNGTFTAIGFWGRENGVWIKL